MPPKAKEEKRPPLVRGWSAKVVLPTQHLEETDLNVLICNISKSGLVQIARELTENEDLQRLDLRCHFLVPADGRILSEGLAINFTLRALDLRCNDLSDEGIAHIATALQLNGESVLYELNVCSNLIGDAGAQALGSWMQTSSVLKNLRLRDNHIGSDGAAALGKGLSSSRSMKTLDLSSNLVGDKGAVFLADGMIAGSSGLLYLDLSSNGVEDKGAQRLSEILRRNLPLQRLVLRVNRIREPGLRHLCAALCKSTKIMEFDITGNVVNEDVMDCICQVLASTTSIARFNIGDNFLTQNFGNAVFRALERNENLPIVSLDISHNGIDDMLKQQIDLLIKTNAREVQRRDHEKHLAKSIKKKRAAAKKGG